MSHKKSSSKKSKSKNQSSNPMESQQPSFFSSGFPSQPTPPFQPSPPFQAYGSQGGFTEFLRRQQIENWQQQQWHSSQIPTQMDYSTFHISDSPNQNAVPETQPFQVYRQQVETDSDETAPEDVANEESDSSPDEVPITGKFANRQRPKAWTAKEEEILAKAWITISEDEQVGNFQTSKGFWQRILEYYQKEFPLSLRTHHQLNSKWGDLQRKVSKFCNIYNNLVSEHRSGANESTILNETHQRYRMENNNKPFNHISAWLVLKDHPKWETVPLMGTQVSKRTKLSGGSNTHTSGSEARFPLGDVPEAEEEEEPRRRKGKEKVSSSSKSSKEERINQMNETMNRLQCRADRDFDDRARHRMEMEKINNRKVQLYEDHLVEKSVLKDMEFFFAPHDHLVGQRLEVTLNIKRKMAAKHGWACDF